jgi:hypothetical protein
MLAVVLSIFDSFFDAPRSASWCITVMMQAPFWLLLAKNSTWTLIANAAFLQPDLQSASALQPSH